VARTEPRSAAGTEPASRKRLRDNTKLLLAGIAALIAALAGLLALASRGSTLAPDYRTEFVLYALSATNLMMLLALVFVLARNIVKIMVERRRGLPFARFRAKLVLVLLGMTLIPAVLVLLVGSELIRNSVDTWFNRPMEEMLISANGIASDYYSEQQRAVSMQAQRHAAALANTDLNSESVAAIRSVIAPSVEQQRVGVAEVYRLDPVDGPRRVANVVADRMPQGVPALTADALVRRVADTGVEAHDVVQLPGGGELIRAAAPIRASARGRIRGVAIASQYLTDRLAARARGITAAYEDYQQLRVLRRPLTGVYLSFFLMLTLMILVGATWMGLYLAKRITRPVQMLAAATKEIGAGHLDHRVEPETRDEFGSLIESFNRMAGELAVSRQQLERSALALERRHEEVEGRRRYVETVLDRIATGVVSIDAAGRIRTCNSAASRLLGIDAQVSGLQAGTVFGSAELRPLAGLLEDPPRSREDSRSPEVAIPKEVTLSRHGRELHLAVMTTPLRRDDGVSDGMVVVLDDVSALIRAQKVAAWREVARRLAHEIKNPLTPIQLCAERLSRHFARAPASTRELVDECTATIVGEVESLKGLVDEFSQFARMPAPRTASTDLHALLDDVLGLYRGLFTNVELRRQFGESLPKVAVDPEQIRRVMINLVDNALEAMDHRGTIEMSTQHDPANNLVRVVVADDGPGIPPAEREKLFLPYYSTKKRGSGLGLAIVRRIVVEHGGSIDVTDNAPHGTRLTVELPA
jgi:two-component system nitrogen regulation sensor histidine kinase NtrY